jgi:hypothetical protein
MIAINTVLAIDAARDRGVCYFASGSNHPGEILALADARVNVGIAVHELRHRTIEALAEAALAWPQLRVFVDSGAFSEVTFPSGVPTVSRPITAREWRRRLAIYLKLAKTHRQQLYVVAPDCIAHQDETLYRMSAYAELVNEIAAWGANILVPMQRGELESGEFWALAVEALGVPVEQLIPAVPMKKDATSDGDFELFLDQVNPYRVHLLGLGPKSRRFESVLAMCEDAEVEVLCDSVLVTSLVGRTNGSGGGPRALTEALDDAQNEFGESAFDPASCGLDWTDHASDPSWLTPKARRAIIANLTPFGYSVPPPHQDRAWEDFMVEADDIVEHEFRHAWVEYVSTQGSAEIRKRMALARCLGAR